MRIPEIFKSCYNGFQKAFNFKNNGIKTNIVTAILSSFAIIIPLGVYRATSLYGRIRKYPAPGTMPKQQSTIIPPKITPVSRISGTDPVSEIIQTDESINLRTYTGDLSAKEKSNLSVKSVDQYTLKITIQKNPSFNVTIRRENIMTSGADVIVNAANRRLRKGHGIDGQIHKDGGKEYEKKHQELKSIYIKNNKGPDQKRPFVSGHAAMIGSGNLKQTNSIDHVIVVAGPKGPTTSPEKENELYSCYYNSLLLAHSQNKNHIAFPSISTGAFHFPGNRAASIALKAIYDFIDIYPDTTLKTISIHFLKNTQKEDSTDLYKTAATILDGNTI